MMTARVLVLDHPEDRREIAARFAVDDLALRETTWLVNGLQPDAAQPLAAALRASGHVAAAARAGVTDDLLAAGPAGSLIPYLHALDRAVGDACAIAWRRFDEPPPVLRARTHLLPMDGRPLIVGILNATPDSFYDGGRHVGLERSVARAEEMAAEGVDIIEVGGETARPSVPMISVAEETARVTPVIEAIASRLPLPIGVDTYKPDVARAALAAGAAIVNDISGLADHRMATVAAGTGAALVITHIQGRPKIANPHAQYERVMDEVYGFLADRAGRAEMLGVPRESLIVDPGLSFGKQAAHDVTVVRRLRELRGLGLPIYLAASRKNFIRDLLGLPFDELLEGTMAVVALGMTAGANLIRTHDVRAMRRFVNMLQAIRGPTPPVVSGPVAGAR